MQTYREDVDGKTSCCSCQDDAEDEYSIDVNIQTITTRQ